MDEMNAFERQLADVVLKRVGPREPVDDAAVYAAVAADAAVDAQSPKWRVQPMFSATRLIVAGAVVALFGSFLLVDVSPRGDDVVPGADGAIVVDQAGDGTVTTITEALAMASDGDIILVRPGTYLESVSITTDVTVRGDGERDEVVVTAPAGGPTYEPYGYRYAIQLVDSEATVENLTLRGEDSRVGIFGGAPTLLGLHHDGVDVGFGSGAVVILGESTALVRGGLFTGGLGGLGIFGASPTIQENELLDGPYIWSDEDDDGAGDPVLIDNVIHGSRVRGIGLYAPTNARIEGNTISDVPMGIVVGGSGGADITPSIVGNTIEDTGIGIQVTNGARPILEGNLFCRNGTDLMALDLTLDGNTVCAEPSASP